MAPPAGAGPAFGAAAPVPVLPSPAPQQRREEPVAQNTPPEPTSKAKKGASVAPGFSFN
jgi:hypothetical protein